MNTDSYWLSRVAPRPGIGWKDMAALGELDPYGQHRTLWKLFDMPPREERQGQPAPFLFRAETRDGLPVFYVLSRQVPQDHPGIWNIEPKRYVPAIEAGDRLAFKLRVNPVVQAKMERTPDELQQWRERRKRENQKDKLVTKKRVRHDVVMDAKHRMGWKDIPHEKRPTLAMLAYEAGSCWLRDKFEGLGCSLDDKVLRVDGYRTWRQQRGKGIELATLDFEGMLTVTDPERLVSALLSGIGPAKSFGCGLLLVRRV